MPIASHFLRLYTGNQIHTFSKGEYFMDKKTTGLIATIATALLCGCTGLCLCLFGGVTAAGVMPYTTELNGVSNQGYLPVGWGYAMLCLSVIFIAIPIVVGVVTLRKKPEDVVTVAPVPDAPAPAPKPAPPTDDEPLPPAS
jgi:TRAP-type C4-dicarboxylate transport system permease small subunit